MSNLQKRLMFLFTFVILCLSVITLRYTYICLPSLRTFIIWGIGLIIVYIAISLWITHKLQGIHKQLFHCITLQIIPICMIVGTFIVVPKIQMRGYGKINTAEQTFNDLRSKQIVSAKKLGITPLNTRKDVAEHLNQPESEKKLVKISSNSLYYVRDLTHSVPYLVPKAETLLADIAREFQTISGTNSLFEVTSVLRTKEDVSELQTSNANATSNSCHCYATTFDISYVSFKTDILHLKVILNYEKPYLKLCTTFANKTDAMSNLRINKSVII